MGGRFGGDQDSSEARLTPEQILELNNRGCRSGEKAEARSDPGAYSLKHHTLPSGVRTLSGGVLTTLERAYSI